MVSKEKLEKYGFGKLDSIEFDRGKPPVEVEYPKPKKHYRLILQKQHLNIEEMYYWIMTHLSEDWGLHKVEKIKDIFAGSETGRIFGEQGQRLSIQQKQVSELMQTMGMLVKGVFQLVREIRLVKERLTVYRQGSEKDKSAEVVLKGYWVDMKDGGAQNPGSVYGLQQKLGYAVLPDLFFGAPIITKSEDVESHIKELRKNFNERVCEVLSRKLKSYVLWRENTFQEHIVREKILLNQLRTTYSSIQLYLTWLRPYLQNVSRLQQNMDFQNSGSLISAFDGSMIGIEILCYRDIGEYNPVVMVSMDYRSTASGDLSEGYGPKVSSPVGKVEIHLRGYAWSKKEIENYKKLREQESLEIISKMNLGITESLNAMGDELRKYLEEAGGESFQEKKEEDKKEEDKPPQSNPLEPFTEIYSGLKEMFGALSPVNFSELIKGDKEEREKAAKKQKAIQGAEGEMAFKIWQTYKNFKKSHRLVTW